MKTIIEVTQQDIDDGLKKGWKRRCNTCPIALAASRALGTECMASADWGITPVGTITHYRLPDIAMEFIDAFDAELPVKPFTFEIDA